MQDLSIIGAVGVMKIWLRRCASLQQQAAFYQQMAVILQSGLPLLSGLALLQQHTKPAQAFVCYRLQQSLRRGSSLAQAMSREQTQFSHLAVTLVAVGEESGELAVVLQQLAAFYTKQHKMRQFVMQSITYPAILLLLSACVLLLFVLYILPVLADAYAAMGVQASGSLAMLLAAKHFMTNWPLAVAAGIVVMLVLLGAGGKALLRWFLRSTLSGNFHALLQEVRLCRLLALLLESGLEITRAIAIAAEAIDDVQYVRQLQLLNNRLRRGIAIEQAAAGAKEIFTPLVLELVCVGASTGCLPQMLQQAVAAGEQRLEQQLERLKQMLVPLLLLLAAVVIAGIVCLVIGPLFEMLSAMPE